MRWRLHHLPETVSTNLDARAGEHGEVWTADFQCAGRGRLDHRWQSPPGANLLLSAVLSVAELEPERVATLPLAAGVAALRTAAAFAGVAAELALKWPNDVLMGGSKLAGILCERHGECVIVGIGVNVAKQEFPAEIAAHATTLGLDSGAVAAVRDRLLEELAAVYGQWRTAGLAPLMPELIAHDFLRGRRVSVRQTDLDPEPIRGICGGIQADGTLMVGATRVYAGEAHVEDYQ